MGLERIETGKDWFWEWTGTVEDLVDTVGDSDARLGSVTDKVTGAKIWMNLNGIDDPALSEEELEKLEPFYIESPDGDNLYDAYDRKEAVKMLTNIRNGKNADDWSEH